jgi:hypothetical protein
MTQPVNSSGLLCQRLELVDRRFPALFTGEKRETIRWNEGDIVPGYLLYTASKNDAWKTVVWVTSVRRCLLGSLTGYYKSEPAELLASMQRHYPAIALDTDVLFVEHLTPQETLTRYGAPEGLADKILWRAEDLGTIL